MILWCVWCVGMCSDCLWLWDLAWLCSPSLLFFFLFFLPHFLPTLLFSLPLAHLHRVLTHSRLSLFQLWFCPKISSGLSHSIECLLLSALPAVLFLTDISVSIKWLSRFPNSLVLLSICSNLRINYKMFLLLFLYTCFPTIWWFISSSSSWWWLMFSNIKIKLLCRSRYRIM